jgi:hypothetical protein
MLSKFSVQCQSSCQGENVDDAFLLTRIAEPSSESQFPRIHPIFPKQARSSQVLNQQNTELRNTNQSILRRYPLYSVVSSSKYPTTIGLVIVLLSRASGGL